MKSELTSTELAFFVMHRIQQFKKKKKKAANQAKYDPFTFQRSQIHFLKILFCTY